MQNIPISSRNLDEQIAKSLRKDETIHAQVDGVTRFSNLIEFMPFVVNLAEYCRRRYVVVLTNRRLLVVRVSRMFKKVKTCRSIPLADVSTVSGTLGILTGAVCIELKNGSIYRLERIIKTDVQAMHDQFRVLVLPAAPARTLLAAPGMV